MSVDVYSVLRLQYGCNRLESDAEEYVVAVAYAALYASTMIGKRHNTTVGIGVEHVVLLAAAARNAVESVAILKPLHGVYAEHRTAKHGVQLAELRLTQPCRTTFYHASYHSTHSVALAFHAAYEFYHTLSCPGVRTSHHVVLNCRKVVLAVITVYGNVAHLRGIGRNAYAQLPERGLGKRSSHTAGNGYACRRASTASVVAQSVFLEISIIGMRRAEHVAQIVVVAGVLIGVSNDETDGRTGRTALKHAAEQLNLVGLFARRGDAALARSSASQLVADELHIDTYARRHPVYHSSYGLTVAFAERSEPEYVAECISHFAMLYIPAGAVAAGIVLYQLWQQQPSSPCP